MCDICKSMGDDYRHRNGPKRPQLYHRKLYRVFRHHLVHISLCYIHDIELFLLGEKEFLKRNVRYANRLREGKGNVEERNVAFGGGSSGGFGF
ncbi:MAG: hypothetical protein ACPGJV_09550 [Bacteriovoracaceae bacterium]